MTKTEQSEPKTIAEVLQSVEARSFWERAYLVLMQAGPGIIDSAQENAAMYADVALRDWQERFGPKAAE